LGIGPWRVYTLGPDTGSDITYRGQASPHTMKNCMATTRSMEGGIIQPVVGPTIYPDFLEEDGEGVHHVAGKCPNLTWAEKVARLEAQGFRVIQAGSWLGKQPYACFQTEAATGTTFEMWDDTDFVMPKPEELWPDPHNSV